MKKILTGLLLITLIFSQTSCSEDEFTDSIFVEKSVDKTAFDKWLDANYLEPYNLDFRYRMQDAGSNTSYNLVPTKLEKSEEMAILAKYLWFDVYGEVVNEDFLKYYGPRMIHLIGSAAYNPNQRTRILGTAEGGIKVTLYDCNQLQADNIAFNNEYYFHTMHHEFMHILHQQKAYPKEFETLSAGYYDPMYWQERDDDSTPQEAVIRDHSQYAPLGFVSAYASSQPREDFVETISLYITKSDDWWNELLRQAALPGPNGETMPGTGAGIIEEKINICKKWLLERWDINLDSLRQNVRERQLHVNEAVEKGKAEIDSYK
ncbi:MAG: putative zinc-binding metallopeptidase [Paludibacter sp.]|nr:putative zinc-binding metallopeptidase [Paludibacter sp.]